MSIVQQVDIKNMVQDQMKVVSKYAGVVNS